MNFKLKIWRQNQNSDFGYFKNYEVSGIIPEMSFLEMLDVLNEDLLEKGEEPIAFEHDCREGICGSCGFMIDGVPHGSQVKSTTCQLHMRSFKDGDEIVIEPFRASSFKVLKDLIVDRSAFDRIIRSGGYISVRTGSAPDAHSIPVKKEISDSAFDSATCIGCGGCAAVCPNASAMLFVGAKLNHLNSLPQGKVELKERTKNMVEAMDNEGFGHCTNYGACSSHCPKGISLDVIVKMNRDYIKSLF